MVVGDFLQLLTAEDFFHLGFERLCEETVDIVVAIIDENEAALLHICLEVLPLFACKLYELVSAQVAEGAPKDFITGQGYDVLLRVHR
jgi:hypothetical protein